MAEEIPDHKFKADVMQFIDTAIKKFDGLTADVRTNSFKLDRLENSIGSLETKVDENTREIKSIQSDVRVLGGQFQDVAGVVIKDTQRLTAMEQRVDILEQEPH